MTGDAGLTRGKRGLWEKRAARRLADGSFLSSAGRLEARVFHYLWRFERKLFRREETARTFIDPGHKTGTAPNAASESREAMTGATSGK